MTLYGHSMAVTGVDWSHDGTRIVSASMDGTLRVWDAVTGEELLVLRGHTNTVNSVHISSDDRWVLSGSDDGTIRLWNLADGTQRAELIDHAGAVQSVQFSRDGSRFVSTSVKERGSDAELVIFVWDAGTREKLFEIPAYGTGAWSSSISPDSARLAVESMVDGKQQVGVWDLRSGELLLTLEDSEEASAVAYSPDGTLLCATDMEGVLHVWDAATGTRRPRVAAGDRAIFGVCFSPDGMTIATAEQGGVIRIRDAATGLPRSTFYRHRGAVDSLCFSPDGRRLASAGIDMTVKVWTVPDDFGRQLFGFSGQVTDLAFSADGRQLATVSQTGSLSLNVPWIIRNGPERFAALGTATSKGTKVFSLAGKVRRAGLIEIPLGLTIREVVEGIGGGVAEGRRFKAVQIGGPSGGCVPESLADTPIDYEHLKSLGAMLGSGGLVVLDDDDCMVDVARYFLDFTQRESCGHCTFCRVGTRKLLDILARICAGNGQPRDLDEIESLSRSVLTGSLCGLGKTAPNPVLSTLRYFREEYEAHLQGRCPAGRCKALIRYRVEPNCVGCTLCAQHCPTGAIPLTPYRQHVIDSSACSRCDACRVICPEQAITVV